MVTPSILGPDGQPISTADLETPQTSHVMQLRSEISAHPSRGLTPSRLATILDAAENGDIIAQCELYEDMEEKDGHLASEMLKRRNAACSLDFDIVPPSSPYAREKSAAKQVLEWLSELDGWEEMLFNATDAIGKAFACLEIEWHRIDGVWLPKSITHRPQSWFRLHRGYRQEIRLRDNSADGAVLQPFGWVVHQQKAKSGYLERAALFRVLVWPYLFKNYSVADLAEFLETYGWPIRIGKYPAGASEKEKMTLLRALTSLKRNAAGIMPDGMNIAFEDAVSGDADAFQLMIDWCERTQSKAILGGTLTSQADGKSSTNALGNVHNEVRKDLRNGDAKALAETLSRDLIYPMAVLNGLESNIRRAPRLRFDTKDRKDIAAFATSLPPLVNMGFRVPRKWAQEEIGIPEPEEDETDLLKPAPKTPAPGTTPATQEAAVTALSAQQRESLDPPARMADLLDTSLQPAMNEWIGKIRDLAERATSLEEIRDGIAALAPELTLDQYTAAMRQALAAAALAGRYEILREAGSA